MKTSVVKRVVALTLAGLIILGTLGYFFSVVGSAAEDSEVKIGDFKVSYKIIAEDTNDKIIENKEKVSIEV